MRFGAKVYPSLENRLMKENAKLKREIEKLKRSIIRTTTKLVKAKETSISALKKRAWHFFSKWIRLRDNGVCFTCGKQNEIKKVHAGHYIDSSICGAILNFSPLNVHCQCIQCNVWKHGAKSAYRANMVLKYGQAKVDHLDEIRTKTVGVFKPTRQYYLSMAAKYKALVEGLQSPPLPPAAE